MILVALGALLRFWNLSDQLVSGDEMFGVRVALPDPLVEVLTRYRVADPCLPTAGFLRVVLVSAGFLEEWMVRLPSLVSGLLALVLLPLLASSRLGSRRTLLLTGLLAVSPMLVLYSRIGRPYMPIALMGGVAFLVFDRWASSGGRRWAGLWILASALAIWLHPVSLPFVVAPWCFELLRFTARGRASSSVPRGAVSLTALVGSGVVLLAVLLVLIGPALPSLVEVLQSKQGGGSLHLESVTACALDLAGTGRLWLAILFWGLVVVGAWRTWRRQPVFAARGLFALGAQGAALWVLSPWGAEHPFILARYMILALPLILIWVVAAFFREEGAAATASAADQGVLAAVAILVLILGGPFADPVYRYSSFLGSDAFLRLHRDRPRIPTAPQSLLDLPHPGPLLIAPWSGHWPHDRFHGALQELHRRPVIGVPSDPGMNDPRLAFRNLCPPSPAAMLASRARYLIVVLDLASEDERLCNVSISSQFTDGQALRYVRHAETLVRKAGEILGPPMHQDDRIVIWDLEGIREGRGEARRGEARREEGDLAEAAAERRLAGSRPETPERVRTPRGVQSSLEGLRSGEDQRGMARLVKHQSPFVVSGA